MSINFELCELSVLSGAGVWKEKFHAKAQRRQDYKRFESLFIGLLCELSVLSEAGVKIIEPKHATKHPTII